jgi:hypothetical protein
VFHYERKEYPAAIKYAERAVKADLKFADAHALLGSALHDSGDISMARVACETAARLDPRNWGHLPGKLPALPVAPRPRTVVPAVVFDVITLEEAARLNGSEVKIVFRVGAQPYAWGTGPALQTVAGPVEFDDIARTVVLTGDRLKDVEEGAKVSARGIIRVIRHGSATVNDVVVPAWSEIRFEES